MALSAPNAVIPRVTLGDVPLSIRPGEEHAWTITSGVLPHQRVFEVTTARANQILERANSQGGGASGATGGQTRLRNAPAQTGPLTFKIEAPGRKPVEIQGLYVLANQPGGSPGTRGLLVSDQRWKFPREIVDRAYNSPRRSGERRVVSGAVVPVEVAALAADVGFRRFTLKNGERWTAKQVLDDVLAEVVGASGFVYDDTPTFDDPVQGFTPPRPGHEAIAAALAFLPGMQIYPGPDGKIHVYSTLLPREREVLAKLGPILWGSGGWEVVDRRRVRPPLVQVYVEREIELRGDYLEGVGPTITPGREPVLFENVLPCPDVTLALASGRTVAQGTWITFDDALSAWLLLADFPAAMGPLTQGLIRRHWPAGITFLHHTYTLAGGAPSLVWARRIAAIEEHWRRSFRLLPQWVDRLRRIRDQRVALLDAETGTRAPAQAFMDYTVCPSYRSLPFFGGSDDPLGWSHVGWQSDLSTASVCPATVEVLDAQTGIFQVTLKPDLAGKGSAILPGQLDSAFPQASAAERIALWTRVGLSSTFNMAIIFSGTPDAPNDPSRLHREVVEPGELGSLLHGLTTVGPCEGPIWNVTAGDETARFAWTDSASAQILEAVYTGADPPRENLVNPTLVRDVAKAQAARIYALLLDRAEGSFSTSLDPTPVPTGSIQQVRHAVRRSDGMQVVSRTDIIMPPILTAPSINALLPEATRRILRKLVDP